MKEIATGKNRTGLKASPMDAAELLEIIELYPKPIDSGERALIPSATALRLDYRDQADPVGTMPPPATLKGMFGAVMQALSGHRQQVLLDKLGERAAYERTGTRLYEAALRKFDGIPLPEGMSYDALLAIRNDEAFHFSMLTDAIEQLGGDPTTQTPCADVVGVQGMGLLQVMNDPRTTPSQALQVLLSAELIDNASWELLIELSAGFGLDDLLPRFNAALDAEERHLDSVRAWHLAAVMEQGLGEVQADRVGMEHARGT